MMNLKHERSSRSYKRDESFRKRDKRDERFPGKMWSHRKKATKKGTRGSRERCGVSDKEATKNGTRGVNGRDGVSEKEVTKKGTRIAGKMWSLRNRGNQKWDQRGAEKRCVSEKEATKKGTRAF